MGTYMTVADPEAGILDDIVDTSRYPIDIPRSDACTELIESVRRSLATDGAATLPGFLRADALHSIARQLQEAAAYAPVRQDERSVYARGNAEVGLDEGDPRQTTLVWNAGHVTRDMIPAYADSHRLYVSPLFKGFVAACVGEGRVFEYADPIAGLVATILPPGGQYPWHYDTTEFVVTIMIQAPEAGGQFEYCKDLRTPGDENLDGLGRVLDGTDNDRVRVVNNEPGDLQLFLGRYSLHQVTPVEGTRARHVLVLSYADRPGVIGPLDRTRSVYGRVTEAHLVAAESYVAESDGLIL